MQQRDLNGNKTPTARVPPMKTILALIGIQYIVGRQRLKIKQADLIETDHKRGAAGLQLKQSKEEGR